MKAVSIIGYTPHSGQSLLHSKIAGDKFYYTFNIGRQWGKTMMMINQMLMWGFNHKGVDIAFISPTLKQSRRVFHEIIKYNNGSTLLSFNKSELSITFINGSSINFFSSEQGDNIRGYHFHYVVRDESAYQPNNFFNEVVGATLLAKGVKSVDISTPSGRNSDHFKRYNQYLHNDDLYYSYTAPSSSNPFLNKVILDDIRKQVPDHVWRQEYLAEFIDGGVLFKNINEVVNNKAKPKGRSYGGLDIGRADDYTVLTIVNSDNEMIHCERWRHLEWKSIVSKVATVIRRYGAHTTVEVNNQGDVVYEMLHDTCGSLVTPLYTSVSNKNIMIENLITLFEQKEITIFDIDWLKMELESFTFVYNPRTRRVSYSAPQGLHDDSVMSLAICMLGKKESKFKGIYAV